MYKSLVKAEKHALPCAFQKGYEKANDGLKNAPLYLVETTLTKNGPSWYIGGLVRT